MSDNPRHYTRSQAARAKVQREAMSSENIPRFTRSQAARVKNQNMEDDIDPEDSASQVNVSARRTSSRVSSAFSSHSLHSRSARSKEQLDLDISALAIKIDSQQRRARLEKEKLDVEKEMEKKKLDIELEMEKINLQEEMDLAKNERESLDRENSDIVRTPEQIKNSVNEEIQKMLNDCYTFIDDCCIYLGSGKVDPNGKKACRVYMRPDKNVNKTEPLHKSIEPEKTHIPALKIPRTSTVKKETEKLAKPISVCPQKDEAEHRIVTVTSHLPEIPTKESSIGYFPSPRPEHSDKALEALYRQQTMMMGALQAPKIELMEFHGDPML